MAEAEFEKVRNLLAELKELVDKHYENDLSGKLELNEAIERTIREILDNIKELLNRNEGINLQ